MRIKRGLAVFLAATMAASAFVGCGGNTAANDTTTSAQTTTTPKSNADGTTAPTTKGEAPFKLSVLLPGGSHANDELDLTITWRELLENYTNTDITWELYDSNSYYEKLTLKYASGELATVMVTDQNAEFMSACKYNTFWDLTDYLDLYDNLSVIPASVRMNASQDGKLYGVPRSRNLGRNACSYRSDWADRLGLGHPETINDLYEMAVAFTNNDPDGNGKNDTYGFGLDSWSGQWDIMFPWFGVHNVWGFDENGKLEYYAMQDEFKTALKEFQKWNSEGLINEGWNSLGAGKAEKEIFRNNIAGIQIQVADTTRKSQEAMNGSETAPGNYPDARFTYFGAVEDGTHGYNVLPTAGYNGYVAVTKALAPTEAELLKALQFLNDVNDAYVVNLVQFGLEGKDHYIDANGYGVRYTSDEKSAMGISTASYRDGYNQMLGFWHNAEEAAKILVTDPSLNSDIRNAENAIKVENEQYTIANYGAGFTSETYVKKGAELDDMIEKAILDFILGNIDEVGLDAQLQTWLEAGGQDYINEINAAYEASKN